MSFLEVTKKFLGIGYKSQYKCLSCGYTSDNFKVVCWEYVTVKMCPKCESEDFTTITVKK